MHFAPWVVDDTQFLQKTLNNFFRGALTDDQYSSALYFHSMNQEATNDEPQETRQVQEHEKLLLGMALKTRCGYRLLRRFREAKKHNPGSQKSNE